MVFKRLDVDVESRIVGDNKVYDVTLKKVSPLPVSYRVQMEVGDLDLGTVKAGKLLFLKEMELELDEGVPADDTVKINVTSWGGLGLFLANDEGTFEG